MARAVGTTPARRSARRCRRDHRRPRDGRLLSGGDTIIARSSTRRDDTTSGLSLATDMAPGLSLSSPPPPGQGHARHAARGEGAQGQHAVPRGRQGAGREDGRGAYRSLASLPQRVHRRRRGRRQGPLGHSLVRRGEVGRSHDAQSHTSRPPPPAAPPIRASRSSAPSPRFPFVPREAPSFRNGRRRDARRDPSPLTAPHRPSSPSSPLSPPLVVLPAIVEPSPFPCRAKKHDPSRLFSTHMETDSRARGDATARSARSRAASWRVPAADGGHEHQHERR